MNSTIYNFSLVATPANSFISQKVTLRNALISYITVNTSRFNYAATLTFNGGIENRHTAENAGRKFQQNYNNALGLQNWQRKYQKDETKRAPMITVLEGDGRKTHFHYHLILKKPHTLSHCEYVALVKRAWIKTRSGSIFKNEIEPVYDLHGWTGYITKEINSSSTDAIHWEATHIFTEKNKN